MHVDQAGRHYTTVGGERRAYPTYLLRRSFRDEHGRPRKETLANLTGLPEESIAALRDAEGPHPGRRRGVVRGAPLGAARERGGGARDGLGTRPAGAAGPGMPRA